MVFLGRNFHTAMMLLHDLPDYRQSETNAEALD
jgi:hypothetical protein